VSDWYSLCQYSARHVLAGSNIDASRLDSLHNRPLFQFEGPMSRGKSLNFISQFSMENNPSYGKSWNIVVM